MSQIDDKKDDKKQEDTPEVTVIVKQPPKPIVDKPKREMTEKQKAAFEKMRSGLQKWREERPDYSARMKQLVQAEKESIKQRIEADSSLPPNAKVVVKSRRGRQPGTKFPHQGRQVFTPAVTDIESEPEPTSRYSESSSLPTTDTDTTDYEDERKTARKQRRQQKKKQPVREAADQMQAHLPDHSPALVRSRPVNPMASYLSQLNGGGW